jgi:hypothetical protein
MLLCVLFLLIVLPCFVWYARSSASGLVGLQVADAAAARLLASYGSPQRALDLVCEMRTPLTAGIPARPRAVVFSSSGGRATGLRALAAAAQARAAAPAEEVVFQYVGPLDADLSAAFDAACVRRRRVPDDVARALEVEFETAERCHLWRGCWLKLLAWNMSEYSLIMHVDNDLLLLQDVAFAFEAMERESRSPLAVGGVPDLVFAYSHQYPAESIVFNGGLFIAQPDTAAFGALMEHARSHPWRQAEMMVLNTFAAERGQWVHLPAAYNVFPRILEAVQQRGKLKLSNIAGLHFVGSPGGPCGLFGRSFDGLCQIWLAVQGRAEALLGMAAQQLAVHLKTSLR